MTLTVEELRVVREALAMAASRHEAQARSLIGSFAAGAHDRKATAMRNLRVRFGRELVSEQRKQA